MKLAERMGRMLRADAHGMMDELEERSSILRQSLREAENEIEQKRARLESLDEQCERIAEAGRRLESQVAALDEDVELARAGEDPDLARFAVKRWLAKRQALKGLFERAACLEAERARLSERLALQESQLAELRPRVRAALARPTGTGSDGVVCEAATVVTEEEIDLELLRRRRDGSDVRVGEGA